jgi:hypothetical protein|tara:strand:+ start:561 stop:713 length:153 start_codon:yes stop_codon:yes gene_type:complete
MSEKKTAPKKAPALTTSEKIQQVAESIDPNQPLSTADVYRILLRLADALK